jgi:hypothetical protein
MEHCWSKKSYQASTEKIAIQACKRKGENYRNFKE